MSVDKTGSVCHPWVAQLPMMQQSVLMAAVRGPDGVRKEHNVKQVVRWYRRCFLYQALDRTIVLDPLAPGGGSFTGPVDSHITFMEMRTDYLSYIDELPHHFNMHLMHGAQILGFKHPEPWIRTWWMTFYFQMCNHMHLQPEMMDRMDRRLGDSEAGWLDPDFGEK